MTQSLVQMLPLLIVGVCGFFAMRVQLLSQEQLAGLGRFLILFAVPALLFGETSRTAITSSYDWQFPLIFGLSGLASGALSLFICTRFLRVSGVDASVLALGAAFPNSIAIGFPVALQLVGDSVLEPFAAILLVETLVFLPLGLFLLESQHHVQGKGNVTAQRVLLRILKNPILLAIVTGTACTVSGLTLPSVVYDSTDKLGRCVGGLALFFAGGLVARADAKLVNTPILFASLSKVIGAPLFAALLLWTIMPLQAPLAMAVVLFCAAPSFSSLAAIAADYNRGAQAAGLQGLSTALSVLTIPVVILLIG